MSNSLASQWIRPTLMDLVGVVDTNEAKSSASVRRPMKQRPHIAKPKAVQVVGWNEGMRTLTVSDGYHSITVFLTIDAVNNIKNSDNLPVAIRDNFTLETLNYSFIKLEVYHFSIVMIAGADRDVCHFSSNKISLPIALNCNLLTFIGSDDVSVIGNPVDLNMALHRENFFGKHELKFSVLVEKLGLKQFEKEKHLPAYDFKFKRATEYNATYNELSISHCIIPADQLAILNNSEVTDIKLPRPVAKTPPSIITTGTSLSIPVLPDTANSFTNPPSTSSAANTSNSDDTDTKSKKNKKDRKDKKKKKKRDRDADGESSRNSKKNKIEKGANRPRSLQSLLGSFSG